MRGCLLVVTGMALCAMSSAALAQNDSVDYEEAKARYTAAETAAKAGDWEKAAKEYGIAYEITKDPILFYKIAGAYKSKGDCEEAVIYYGRYIKEANPEQKFKERAEKKIAECKAKIGETGGTGGGQTGGGTGDTGTGAGTGTGTGDTGGGGTGTGTGTGGIDDFPDGPGGGGGGGPPSFDEDKSTWTRTAAWASVGGVVTFATIGAVLGLSANSREEDIENLFITQGNPQTFEGTIKERYEDLIDEGEKLETYSYIAFGAAGVAAAAATLFFVLDAGSGNPEENAPTATTISPQIGPNQVGMAAEWRF